MPRSIPYDPTLTMMGVVSDAALKNIEAIAALQAPVDAAQDTLNSLILSRRSLNMTKTELQNLGVGTEALDSELKKLDQGIEKAAGDYAAAKMVAESQAMGLEKKAHSIQDQIESPMDYLRSEIKTMPLAADTMQMDVQCFSFDSNSQDSAAYSAQIASYVSTAVGSVFKTAPSIKIGNAASRQVSQHMKSHSIEGTLVISASCKHKNASIVAPFVMHVDKAIKVWNRLFPGKRLDPTSRSSMMKSAMDESQEEKERFSIIIGTTFGSSFIAMIHVLKWTNTSASGSLEAAAMSLQRTMDAEGNVGVGAKFASDVKNILSQQNIQSHVTILSTSEMKGGNTEDSLNALATIDESNSKIYDVNSMIPALEDYLKKASEGNSGIPIEFILKDIDQKMLAELWVAKYFPGR